jgi:hypothetical protein
MEINVLWHGIGRRKNITQRNATAVLGSFIHQQGLTRSKL